MRVSFQGVLRGAYVAGFAFIAFMFVQGLRYYLMPLSQRPHEAMHTALKPGGLWGHGFGIIGSAMILLLLFYSARKKKKLGLRFGPLRIWLDVHIFFGIMGPLLITLHTALKFNGIVSISYFSMVLVALSGVFGRYIYMQIPRDPAGHTLSLAQIHERMDKLEEDLQRDDRVAKGAREAIKKFARPGGEQRRGLSVFFTSLGQDVTMRFRLRGLKKKMRRMGVDVRSTQEIASLCRESLLLQRRIAALDTMQRLFHYWHVFHRPFAYIMLIIMVLHVGVTVAFGYRWIF